MGVLGVKEISNRIGVERLWIVPEPDREKLDRGGEASINLKLGRWFRTMRQSRTALLDVYEKPEEVKASESRLTREYFVRFGENFILHPGKFVLGITLEWIGLPEDVSGYVTGKSSWGRRGLIIETAAGIHPGYRGCLTLELTNVGEVPIALYPGMDICQVFFHEAIGGVGGARGQFSGRRNPVLGSIRPERAIQMLRPG